MSLRIPALAAVVLFGLSGAALADRGDRDRYHGRPDHAAASAKHGWGHDRRDDRHDRRWDRRDDRAHWRDDRRWDDHRGRRWGDDRWDRHERRDDRWDDRRHYRHGYRDGYRHGYRDDRRYDYARYRAPRVYVRPVGYRHHYWRAGHYLPPPYRGPVYVIDYRPYHLPPPPRGHYWYRVDNDVVLAAIATGLIIDVLPDLFY